MRETFLGDYPFADCPIIVVIKVWEDVGAIAVAAVGEVGEVGEGARQGRGGENDGEDCRSEAHFSEEIDGDSGRWGLAVREWW